MTFRYKTRARFANDPVTVHLGNGWHLSLEPLHFDIGMEDAQGDPVYLTAPVYQLSDGPSIPWFVEWLVSRKDTMHMGFLHDALRSGLKTSNFATDGLMLDAAMACGLPFWRAWLAFIGVRLGTLIGFKSEAPAEVIASAVVRVMEIDGLAVDEVQYSRGECRILTKKINQDD